MFHVGGQHLEGAFFRHKALGASMDPTDSHLLLLLYSAECGLKRLLLKQRSLHSTARLDEDDLTHDLDELLRKLGSRERFGTCPAEPGPVSIPSERLHEVLRYGGRLPRERRAEIASRASSVLAWIEEAL
jgi:hypothetical protein